MSERTQAAPHESIKRFLHHCLRARWDPTELEAARSLAHRADLDWNSVRKVAEAQGVVPLLDHLLRGQDIVPAEVERFFRSARTRLVWRDTFLGHELAAVVVQMEAAGIEVMLLKGAALANTVYGDAALRPMIDLDLLVRERDVPDALQVLGSLGHRPIAPTVYRSEVIFRKRGRTTIPVELHWHLFVLPYYQHTLRMDWFWQTALPVTIGSASAWMLGPEAQLLFLCGHMRLHHADMIEPSLIWLHDVAEVISLYRDQIDWDELLARAQMYDLVLPTQQVLMQVARDWLSPIPVAVLDRLHALRPSRGEERVFAQIEARHSSAPRRFRADLATLPGWGPRLRTATESATPFSFPCTIPTVGSRAFAERSKRRNGLHLMER